jgi:mRNA interferase MazF
MLNSVIAVPATSTVRGLPTEVRLGLEDGLPQDCVLTLDNVTLIRKSALVSHICRLSSERMRDVCKALAIATGCDLR